MTVGILSVSLRLEGPQNLKEKRRIVRGLIDRISHDFRVAVAEVDDHNLWGNATLGVACVSTEAAHADSVLQHVLDHIDSCPDVSVEYTSKDIQRH